MAQDRKNEAVIEELEEPVLEPRRHRRATEVRLPAAASADGVRPSAPPPWPLGSELRGDLWATAHAVLFDGGEPNATLRRVWSTPPIVASTEGVRDGEPEDVERRLERWFAHAPPADVLHFLETSLECLEPMHQARFIGAINAVLERGDGHHRFVLRRLVPMTSRSDVAAVERAVASSRAAHWVEVEASLLEAVAHLASAREPSALGAIRAVTEGVRKAAEALTHESYVDFEDALHGLEAHGHVERALVATYAGLMPHVNDTARKTAPDDARLIVVMCAGFVIHLAARLGR